MNTASTLATTNPTAYAAVKQKSAWMIDNSKYTSLDLAIGGDKVFHDTDGFSAVALTGVGAADVTALKSATAVSRATDLGVTLDVTAKGYPLLPAITFSSSISSATGANGEAYDNTGASDLSNLLYSFGDKLESFVKKTYFLFCLINSLMKVLEYLKGFLSK